MSADPPVILIADDSADIRLVLSMVLEDCGYRTVEAVDGQHALELALDHDVSLIVLDYAMPRLNGDAFCAAYRARGGQAPVILLSAANPETVAAAVEACGAVGFIPKPFDVESVVELIARHAGPPPAGGFEQP